MKKKTLLMVCRIINPAKLPGKLWLLPILMVRFICKSATTSTSRAAVCAAGDVLTLDENGATIEFLDTAAYSILELKTRQGTFIVFAGFLLATIASLMFFSGRYQELRIILDHKQSRIWCYSKSPVVVEELQTKLAEQWPETQQEVS